MRVYRLLTPERVLLNLKTKGVEDTLREISNFMEEKGIVSNGEELYRKLLDREKLGSTALPGGIAVPHCKLAELKEPQLTVAISPEGVDFNSSDGKLTHVFFTAVSPVDLPNLHLQILAAIAKLARYGKKRLIERLIAAKDEREVLQIIEEEENRYET